jgi:ribonuclease HIII
MTTIIGSDESLKGDTFGGIAVAAVRADDSTRRTLEKLGVRDSKTISDNKIRLLSERIKKTAPVFFVSMLPEEFNEEITRYGTTEVLNKLHTKCINALKHGEEEIIVDQYPGCRIEGAKLLTHAENKYAEVAAASIIARAEAIKQMKELSCSAGFELPFGSTHVLDALVRIRDEGKDFRKFAKTSFRNVRDVMINQNLAPQKLKNF